MSAREDPQMPVPHARSPAVQQAILDQDDIDSLGFYRHELGRLLLLAGTLEEHLDRDEAAFRAKYARDATRGGIENLYLARDTLLLDEHRNRVRSMLLVAVVSEAEAEVKYMLDAARERAKIVLTIDELKRGAEFDRIRTYSVKVLGIDEAPFNSKAWQQLRAWIRVRNVLVHAQGFVQKVDDIRASHQVGVSLANDDLNTTCGMAQLTARHVGVLGEHVADFLEVLYIALKAKGMRPLSPYLRAAANIELDGVLKFPE